MFALCLRTRERDDEQTERESLALIAPLNSILRPELWRLMVRSFACVNTFM